MSAAFKGHTDIVEYILEKGADMNAKNNVCMLVNY
jgi:ankyrin repeat protein